MSIIAISSLFMTGLAIVVLPMGIYAIRTRNTAAHRRHMASLLLGALLIAGAFSFLPGRFMFEFFF